MVLELLSLEERVVMSSTPFTISSSAWTPVGPTSILNGMTAGNMATSGEVTGIATSATNANLIYIATANGGVWKTIDGGTNWTPLTDTQATLAMGSIALAPSNESIIYAGTGNANTGNTVYHDLSQDYTDNLGSDSYAGMGVLKSVDAGQTWTLLGQSTFKGLAISRIVVNPTDPKTLYAATSPYSVGGPATPSGGGVYKSTDGGQTWALMTASAFPTTNAVTDLDMAPNDPLTLYASVGYLNQNTNGLYKTTDGGQTWKQVFTFLNGQEYDLAIAPSDPNTLYLGHTGAAGAGLWLLQKSTDGGQTWDWTKQTIPANSGESFLYNHYFLVDRNDPNVLYAGAQGIAESVDGGKTWTSIDAGTDGNGPASNYHALAFDANGKLIVGNDGGVWILSNSTLGSIQWTDLNTNLAITGITGLAMAPGDPSTLYATTQRNGVIQTSGNSQWTMAQPWAGGYIQVDPNDPTVIYYSGTEFFGTQHLLRQSTDGLVTAKDVSLGIQGSKLNTLYMPFMTLDPNNGSRILFGSDRINVAVYDPQGLFLNWSTLGTPGQSGWPTGGLVNDIAVAPGNSNTIYAAVSGSVYVTTDNGTTWSSANIPGNAVTQIAIDPDDPRTAFAVRNASVGGKVFKTTDGGQSWTDITGNLGDTPVDSIIQIKKADGLKVLVIGTDAGVYASWNEGITWNTLKPGMPNAKVVQLLYDPASDTLVAGTHGRGVFETMGLVVFPVQAIGLTQVEDTDSYDKVATFQPLTTGLTASDFTASVDWGDGTNTPATLISSNGDGTFSVYTLHHYKEAGNYTFTVNVAQKSGGGGSAQASATISDLPIQAGPYIVAPDSFREGQTYNGPVAQFTDTDPDPISPNAYTATVNWYDSNSTTPVTVLGTVITNPNASVPNSFLVTSPHRLVGGVTRIVTTIKGPGGSTSTATSYINVADSALHLDPSFPSILVPVDGTPFNDILARFTDDDPQRPGPSNYTASVDWGDGSTSSTSDGSLVVTVDPSGTGFLVGAASGRGHVYSPGVYQVTVTVGNNTGDSTASRTYQNVTVEDSPITGQSYPASAVAGVSLTTILASFVDASPQTLPPQDFTATVDWGDGTPVEPATILINYDGGFVVQGTHAYALGGKDYTYTVNFTDVRLGNPPPVTPASASVTGKISVQAASFSASSSDLSKVSLVEGQTFRGTVATITTPNSLADPSSFSATVDWGDGTTSPATIARDGTLSINGEHTYNHWGTYPLRIHLTGPDSRFSSTTNTLTISDAPIQATGSPVSLESLTTTPNLKVASFTVNAPGGLVKLNEYSAQIAWGDGTVTTGQIQPNGSGGYEISGTHSYPVSGLYPISVSINSQGGSNASTSTSAHVTAKMYAISGDMTHSTTGTIGYTTPSFSGVAAPGAQVTLYVVPLSSPRFVPVGSTVADPITGNWSVRTSSLSDGTYAVTASATAPSGDPSSPMTQILPATSTGYLVVDTQGPTIQNVQVNPRTGVVQVNLADQGGGLSFASLVNSSNYSLSVVTRRGTRVLPITGLSVVPQSGTSVSSATLSFSGLPVGGSGTYVIQINAPGITDLAGNMLHVTTYTPFPSVYGQPGQNFEAQFSTNGTQVSPLTVYVPEAEILAAHSFNRLINRRHRRGS